MRDGLPGVDPRALDEYFASHVPGAAPPLDFEVIAGGHSNITFKVTDTAGNRFVLRRPPLGHVLQTAHDMGREHRIISAVAHSTVPVAPALAMCDDVEVNGAPFYVMSFVDGHVVNTKEDAETMLPSEAQRRAVSEHIVDVLADLHLADVDAIGLGGLAKREDYLGRQLKRWRTQWEASKTREIPEMEHAYEGLLARKPEQRHTGIVHGDYRIGNMLTFVDGPDRAHIAAVLDWELCTLGDVLADVGYILNNWIPEDEFATSGYLDPPPTCAPGFLSREEFVERYAARTGFDVSSVEYHRAFSYWRLAAIAEGVKRRYEEGVMADDSFDVGAYGERVVNLARSSVEALERLGSGS